MGEPSRSELLREAEEAAGSLLACLERLARIDGAGPLWPQAVTLTRRMRAMCRAQIDLASQRQRQLAGR